MAMSKTDTIHDLRSQGMGEREAILVSMKKTKAERKADKPLSVPDAPTEDYPYGLRLDLNEDTLDKLGLDTLPDVGDELDLAAKVKVETVSQRTGMDGKKSRSLDLQITDMKLE